MGIAGIAGNSYMNYNTSYTKRNAASNRASTQASNTMDVAPATINLHIGSEDSPDGKAVALLGFPDGSSTSVFKGQDYTTDHPVFKVKTWDAAGNMTETEIDASKVDPANASLQEMMALDADRNLKGEESFGDELMLAAGRLHGDEVSGSYEDFFSKNNWMSEIEDFMDMQFQLGNQDGYLRYKKAFDILQEISDNHASTDSTAKSKSSINDYAEALAQYTQKVKDKIEKGETEETFQIGGQSFTIKEWEKLLAKIDDANDAMKEEMKAEKEAAEQADKTADTVTENQMEELLRDRSEDTDSNSTDKAAGGGDILIRRG